MDEDLYWDSNWYISSPDYYAQPYSNHPQYHEKSLENESIYVNDYEYPPSPKKSNLEILLENFIVAQQKQNEDVNESLRQLTSSLDYLTNQSKMLETQIFHINSFKEETSNHTLHSEYQVNEEILMQNERKEETKESIQLDIVHNIKEDNNQIENDMVNDIYSTIPIEYTCNKYIDLYVYVDIIPTPCSYYPSSFYEKQSILEPRYIQNKNFSMMTMVPKPWDPLSDPTKKNCAPFGDTCYRIWDPGGISVSQA